MKLNLANANTIKDVNWIVTGLLMQLKEIQKSLELELFQIMLIN